LKALDRFLQRWRIAKTRPFIAKGARVLDIGCSDGALFRQLAERIGTGVGIDYDLETRLEQANVERGVEWIMGTFPEALASRDPFDVITLLAVLEHVPRERQAIVARGCARHLKPGGTLLITTPEPVVDRILDALKFFRLIDGMSLEEHYGFEPGETPAIFTSHGLRLREWRKFQLGLNNLFVFERDSSLETC
jgi:2-polyprenyl-3-methyl-5-hydroxy-6-metoxy-1,4-benzoquinol methylase